MKQLKTNEEFETKARMTPICLGCGDDKDNGVGACVVCWACWRHPTHPFKYFAGSLQEWLDTHPQPSLIAKAGNRVASLN